MTISIIIAVVTWQKNLEGCVAKCLELDYPDFEIIILPDAPFENRDCPESLLSDRGIHPERSEGPSKLGTVPIRIIPTGPVSPAKKRDIALTYVQGEIIAFLDDDAYPQRDWLRNAIENFKDPNIAAVGGPAITPEGDSLRQKASGIVYSSFLVSGQYRYRYVPGKRREVDDYPSCNFLVRRAIMRELDGFRTGFWPGEDTKLCLDITKRLGKKIIYDPAVLVYHHRRPLFTPHLKQITSYALHRGYFVKKYPQTSMRIAYFLPSIFVIGLFLGSIISLFLVPIRMIYFLGLFLYLFIVFIFSIIGTVLNPCYQAEGFILSEAKDIQSSGLSLRIFLIPLLSCGIILTHITYGIYFLKGLLYKKLLEEIGTVPDRAIPKDS